MTSAVEGFANMVWLIQGYDGAEQISEERIPLAEASEAAIHELLRKYAARSLTDREIAEVPALLEVTRDELLGNRLTLSCGESPHYVASLWRGDELPTTH